MTPLTVTDLSFTYQTKPIISHLSYHLPSGQLSLLVGPTGCGKSTLLKLMAGLLVPTSGKMSHPGMVSMMFQQAGEQFTMATARDELIFALENLQVSTSDYPKRMAKAVAFTQIGPLLDQPINTLSGGQKQRIALSILIAMDVDVLLLDEPFASVDPEGRTFLIKKLGQLRDQGKTILISDHVLSGYETVCDHLFRFSANALKEVDTANLPALFRANQELSQWSFTLTPTGSVFELQDMTLTTGKQLLQPTQLALYQGAITLITGPNGSGKTTLFKALTKMLPYGGSLKYQQQELTKLRSKTYLTQVAQIFQTSTDQFLRVTVADELALSSSMRNAYFTPERLNQVIRHLHFDDKLDQSVYTLSGGQQKQLQLLLMLMTQHQVLLIDEPLTGLDSRAVKQMVTLMQAVHAALGQTMLIISHQIAPLAPICQYHLHFANQQLNYQEH